MLALLEQTEDLVALVPADLHGGEAPQAEASQTGIRLTTTATPQNINLPYIKHIYLYNIVNSKCKSEHISGNFFIKYFFFHCSELKIYILNPITPRTLSTAPRRRGRHLARGLPRPRAASGRPLRLPLASDTTRRTSLALPLSR